jgi:excisionase family DNA binding protein
MDGTEPVRRDNTKDVSDEQGPGPDSSAPADPDGNPPEDLLTASQAGAVLGMARAEVYALMRTNRLRTVRVDGSRQIPPAALAEFLFRRDHRTRPGDRRCHRPSPVVIRHPLPHPDNNERLTLTVTEAAELLGISRAFAYELVARHELPAIKLGRRLVIPRRAIDDLLAGRTGPETPPPAAA